MMGKNPTSNPLRCEIVKTVDDDWMILIDGVQWGEGPRDRSGCSAQTWPTVREAREAIRNDTNRIARGNELG